MRVLIAEDDAVSRTILRRAVEKCGHECLTAEDGEEAWDLFQNTPAIDAIISDWMMPGIDGLELCRKVRGAQREGYAYFIFLTALGDRQHLLAGLEAGADDYLSKPLDRAELQVRLFSASRVTALHRRLSDQNAELERLNRKLLEQSREDPLTHLGNRLRLREDLEAMSARAKRYGHSYCAILFDIDYFKLYNDTYGHLAGDEVLRKVAAVAEKTIREGDSLYRYGGEEFLAILPEQPIESAAQAAERLRRGVESLKVPHEARKPPPVVTVSLGLAILKPDEKKSVETLLKEADTALYKAKEAGRNCIAIYENPDGTEER